MHKAKQFYILHPFTKEIIFGNNKLPFFLRHVPQLISLSLALWHGCITPCETTT